MPARLPRPPEPIVNTVYCIAWDNESYVGWSNRVEKRLRQHRREIKGGARATRKARDQCRPIYRVAPLATPQHARQLEWRLHGEREPLPSQEAGPFGLKGISPAVARRCWRLHRALLRPRVTEAAPLTAEGPLTISWFDEKLYEAAAALKWPASVTHHLCMDQ